MTENEAIRDLQYLVGEYSAYPPETGVSATVGSLQYCISVLREIQQYREIGTVEQVKNQKENLNVAYQIINDYEQYGTIEDFKMAQRYMRLVKSHGTIGQVINSCAEYEEIGTVEECREAMANKKKCEKQWHNDMENPLEPIKVYSALKSEILKLELRIKNRPKDISILDYTVIAALQKVLKNNLEGMEDE